MFDVTPQEIARLGDADLRSLIGLLCESEAKANGHSPAAVTWGGHQDAPDGGLDVHVKIPTPLTHAGLILKPDTGFQVKASRMRPAEITSEMRPNGRLRPAIAELADNSGAYIIVSSAESTSDRALKKRLESMRDAVHDLPNANGLALDFYDQNRVASWVRCHPGAVLWVKEKLGIDTHGWHPYKNWAANLDEEYLVDTKVRVRHPQSGKTMSIVEALSALRAALGSPGRPIRLVGLSGVGKTRFAQALFDGRIGLDALDPSIAIYADMGHTISPTAQAVLTRLLADGTRAIVIIDNCSPELHRQLAASFGGGEGKSATSLLTIEYDVRDDLPEGTDIYAMDSPSVELTTALVCQRFPAISEKNSRSVAQFAEANTRLALALADAIPVSNSKAELKDSVLFQRLFEQRHPADTGLLRAAQACALVYSFRVDDLTRAGELHALGGLVGMDAPELYRHVADLQRRGLVQARGVWRAVLPQAIAYRLAARGLQDIPATLVEETVMGVPRLFRSFSRQLGYLHASPEAQAIAGGWLVPGGLLADVLKFNELGNAVLHNIAPAVPAETLAAIERAVHGERMPENTERCQKFVQLLRSLAYDPELFDRCAAALVALAHREKAYWGMEDNRWNEAGQTFTSLYFMALSGTHAPISQRLRHLQPLLESADSTQRALGQAALSNALEAWHFSSHGTFDFGARLREFDHPATPGEVDNWFQTVFEFCKQLLSKADRAAAENLKASVAVKFRGIWIETGVQEELVQLCELAAMNRFWREGWLAVKQTLFFDGSTMKAEHRHQLQRLEHRLRPCKLEEQVRALVLSDRAGVDLADLTDDTDASRWQRFEDLAVDLGVHVANDPAAYAALAPEFWSARGGRLFSFGRGLLRGCRDSVALGSQLTADLARHQTTADSVLVIRGYLCELHERSPASAREFLESAVTDPILGPWYPDLQTAVPLDSAGKDRLLRSIRHGKAPIRTYEPLGYGPAPEGLPPEHAAELILAIAEQEGGLHTALDVLSSRLHHHCKRGAATPFALAETGRVLLPRLSVGRQRSEDYKLKGIVEACLASEEGAPSTQVLAEKLAHNAISYETALWERPEFLSSLFAAQPRIMLDTLLERGTKEQGRVISQLQHVSRFHKNPIDAVPPEVTLAWCDHRPDERFPLVAKIITLFCAPNEGSKLREWSPIASQLLNRAPDRIAVLCEYVERFQPSSWSGSLAEILEANVRMLDHLPFSTIDSGLAQFISGQKHQLQLRINQARISERQHEAVCQAFE